MQINGWTLVGYKWSKGGYTLKPILGRLTSEYTYVTIKDGKYLSKHISLENGIRAIERRISNSLKEDTVNE